MKQRNVLRFVVVATISAVALYFPVAQSTSRANARLGRGH